MKTTHELREELTQVKARVTALEKEVKAKEHEDITARTIRALREMATELEEKKAWVDSTRLQHVGHYSTVLEVVANSRSANVVIKIHTR